MRTTRRPYRAIKVNAASVAQIRELCGSKRIVVAVDVAKERMFAAIMDDEERVLVTVKWSHPTESGDFYRLVDDLGGDHRVDVVMEPTGTYDDALRAQLMRQGIAVFQVSPKLVHDAREFYDALLAPTTQRRPPSLACCTSAVGATDSCRSLMSGAISWR